MPSSMISATSKAVVKQWPDGLSIVGHYILPGIPTSYIDLSHDAREKRVHTANAARNRKQARQQMEETDGPPDKHKDFKKGRYT